MSEVNWGAIQQFDNPGERFAQAFQQGQQNREQNIAKAAMAALVRDPSNAKAMEALASVNPAAAMQFQEHQREQAKAQLGAHYDSVMKGAQLIRQTQPKDQASWMQTLSLAQQAGIDISGVPQQFDPNYVQQVVQLADAFKPRTDERGRIITPQPGAGAYELGPDGNIRTLIEPNDGSHQFGTPAQSVKDGATATNPQTGQKIIFRNGQWEPMGGPTPQASGGFPGQ